MDTLLRLRALQRANCRALHARSALRACLGDTEDSLRACEDSCTALAASATAVGVLEAVQAGELQPTDAIHILDEGAMQRYMHQSPAAVDLGACCAQGIRHRFSPDTPLVGGTAEEPAFQTDVSWSVSWEYAYEVVPCTLTLSCMLPAFAGEGSMRGEYALLGQTGKHRVLLCKGPCTAARHVQAVPYVGQAFRSFELHCDEWEHDGWMQSIDLDVV